VTSDRDRASSTGARVGVRLATWSLALAWLAACERGTAPATSPPPTGADVVAPATPPPSDPAAPAETAQAERALDAYAAIEPFLRPRPDASPLSLADSKRVSALLGEEYFDWGETDGSVDSVRMGWLASMSAAATRGEPPSTLIIPIKRNDGWGCEVPSLWVATGYGDADATFILMQGNHELLQDCLRCDLVDVAGREACRAQRCNLQAQGSFTGKTTMQPDYCQHVGHEFRVERLVVGKDGALPFTLALPGGAAPPDGPPIADGPRFGVLLTSAVRHEKGARARADALRTRLIEQGHAGAEVLDSRRIPTLWCCSWAVLVERFTDEKAAKSLAQRLGQEGFDGAVAQALY
jgi:hypothetical protein